MREGILKVSDLVQRLICLFSEGWHLTRNHRSWALGMALVLPGLAAAQTVRIGSEFRVNTYTTSYQEHPSIARNASGEFIVVWQSFGHDGSGFGIFGKRYDPNGVPLGGEFQI